MTVEYLMVIEIKLMKHVLMRQGIRLDQHQMMQQ